MHRLIVIIGLLVATLTGSIPASAEAPTATGERLFQVRCALCHPLDGSGAGQGPNLAGVLGRPAGSTDFDYSGALRNAGFAWDNDHLQRFLASPGTLVPGTVMPVRVTDAGDRRALIAYLGTVKAPKVAAAAATPPAATAPAAATPPAAATAPAAAAAPAAATPPTSDPVAPSSVGLLTGHDAFGDWRGDAPGVRRKITPADLPSPFATKSSGNPPGVVDRPAGQAPHAPPGFRVDLFADKLDEPRALKVAPNGDVFLAETGAGRIRILRAPDGAQRAASIDLFVEGLDEPFGIAFYPPGPDPHFVYVAETNRVLRFAYRLGDLKPSGPAEVVIPRLAETRGGHSTRDLAVSADGTRLFVSVGSGSNVAETMGRRSPADVRKWESAHGLGATWGSELGRADVLSFTPDGGDRRIWATGLRNCVGLAVQPPEGALWCSTNERDGLGDDLVPDYVTRVRAGAYYGWPWYYIGDREDPRLKSQRPDLKGRMTDPDVLLQPHSASLGLTFYTGSSFPAEYRGDAFAAEHGSWNRSRRTGSKVIRVLLKDGVPTGEYEDFLTGFVVDDRAVWGRPVGVAVARDGALLVSEDSNGTIWRVAWTGASAP